VWGKITSYRDLTPKPNEKTDPCPAWLVSTLHRISAVLATIEFHGRS